VLPETTLPVAPVLPHLVATLDAAGATVFVAPPGTGKTTLVPLALAAASDGAQDGRVVVAEPRRLATRAAAARMAWLLGEPVGQRVGYSVRGDSRTSAATRVEVVTSGLLLRRLVADPELVGVGTVVLDECHERHLDADLLLALLLDARAGLRPGLRLLATSATVAGERLAGLLDPGAPAPVLTVAARAFPVAVTHLPPARGERTATATCWRSCPAWPRSGAPPRRCRGSTSTSGRCTGGCRRPSRTPRCGPATGGGWCWRPRWPSPA
jgi:ATP-dependent helicase HrpB